MLYQRAGHRPSGPAFVVGGATGVDLRKHLNEVCRAYLLDEATSSQQEDCIRNNYKFLSPLTRGSFNKCRCCLLVNNYD